MANILSFSNWVKSTRTNLSEQVVTNYDSTYDYKKEGNVYYSKKKGGTTWNKASGKALDAISSKVFKQKTAISKPVTKDVGKSGTKSNVRPTVEVKPDLPFKNKEEGNAFRKWVNTVNPGWAKKNQLDSEGAFDNPHILSAWKVWSQGYKAYLADKQETDANAVKTVAKEATKSKSKGLVTAMRRTFPSIAQYFKKRSLTNNDFTEEHLQTIGKAIKAAIARTGKTNSSTEYVDYGLPGDNTADQVLNKRNQSIEELVNFAKSGPDIFDVATTLGRFSYKKNKDGSFKVWDEYNFSKQYDVTKDELDWDNSNWAQKILKTKASNPEMGWYGAVRHVGYLDSPDTAESGALKINLDIPKEYVA